ncbi:MAG: hypothetical protein KDA87_07405 [Planctomycetales bacterium]|nr:hypothetical protein [Planctomycetales bacterium]
MNQDFDWKRHPETARQVNLTIKEFAVNNSLVAEFQKRLFDETGNRLLDFLDHLSVIPERIQAFAAAGYEFHESSQTWRNASGIFPIISNCGDNHSLMTIKVESVEDFCRQNPWFQVSEQQGTPNDNYRWAWMDLGEYRFGVVQRHGFLFEPQQLRSYDHVESLLDRFRQRPRSSAGPAEDFAAARSIFTEVAAAIGQDWACDLFFRAEREYWMSRNRAAQVQYARQQQLGLGWANHDHHTFRCSREHFADLVKSLEHMGFECRERFYAGRQAGWGAQVLEQPTCGFVVFADVDMAPEEVSGDFAHAGLSPANSLGTVGLWCKLHGEAFLQAGLHHLECQFDFEATRDQLATVGIETMAPFTDFPHLKQAFTKGEVWPVSSERIDALLNAGLIDANQAEQFRSHGAIGSHLEILERNEGFKGFNQTGISDIISKTDPRLQTT